MKKILLGSFLLVSVLSFSATRKVPAERIIMDQTTGIAYVQGENKYHLLEKLKLSLTMVKFKH